MTRGNAITGWATAVPDTVVTNEALSQVLDTSDSWIGERTGIRERRVACGPFAPVLSPALASAAFSSTLLSSFASAFPSAATAAAGSIAVDRGCFDALGTTANLAIEAGRKAISAASLRPDEIDLLIVCTMSPDQTMPPTSAAVQAALGVHCAAFDLNSACSGFVYGLVTAVNFIAAGTDRVLLIGAETMSRLVDWTDRTTAVLFGDGAGALVIEAVPGESSLLGWDLGSEGAQQSILYADLGGCMRMVGKEVFRRAVRATVKSSRAAMEQAKLTSDDIALFVPHQANARIIEAACQRLEIPRERTAINLQRTGNTGSASIPLALLEASAAGRISEGDLVLMSGFGAGMTWASAVWRWGSGLV